MPALLELGFSTPSYKLKGTESRDFCFEVIVVNPFPHGPEYVSVVIQNYFAKIFYS
jgi:hypothetical protein